MSKSVCMLKIRVVNSLADTAHAKSVRLIVVVHAYTAAIEVHPVRLVSIVLHGRPIVAVRTGIVQRTVRVVAVTDSGKRYSRRLQKAMRDITNRTTILSTKSVSCNRSQ